MLCGRDSGQKRSLKKEEKGEKKNAFTNERKKDKSSTNDDDDDTETRKEGIIDRDRSIDRSIIAR